MANGHHDMATNGTRREAATVSQHTEQEDMIKKIVIKDVASYDHEGCTFDDLAKVNIILGGNGTGKTTLSRVIYEPLSEDKYPNCKVEYSRDYQWKEVYNKDFRERNIRSDILGVFTLGETWVELQKKIDAIRPQRDEVADRALDAREKVVLMEIKIDKEEKVLREHLWRDVYQPHKDMKECLRRYARKAAFAKHLIKEVEYRDEKKAGHISGYGRTADMDIWKRAEVKDVSELRRRYKELYEDTAEIDMTELETGRLFYERDMLNFDVWQYLAAKADKEVKRGMAVINAYERKLKRLKKKDEAVTKELNDIDYAWDGSDGMIASMQPTIDRINATLKNHGYSGFRIQVSPDYPDRYQIQREDGSFVENTLSEGEETLITMLYFLECVKGSIMKLHTRSSVVVVIDDPISSLDRSAMELVAEKVKELMDEARNFKEKPDPLEDLSWLDKEVIDPYEGEGRENEVEQVIVLTHNKVFHKMISSRARRKDTHYWELYKTRGVSRVTAYGEENHVKSDYALAWTKLKEVSKELEKGEFGNVICLPNLMRKIVETYFVDYGRYDKQDLMAGDYCKEAEDKDMVASLSKWMDEGCHAIMDNMYGDVTEVALNSLGMFERLFKVMGQEEHYRMMMREE